MKLLRVITSMHPAMGGPCQGIRNSITELEKLGIHNEVVCMDEPGSDFIRLDQFVIHAVGKARGPWAYHQQLLPWLVNNLQRFDIVIVHGLWQYHGFAVRRALKLCQRETGGPKLFVMPHGMLDPWFQKAKGRKLKAIRNFFYWKWIESKLINTASGVLFTCTEELRLARQTFQPYHPAKELNVGYGINMPPRYDERMQEAFHRRCPGTRGEPYILFLSRVHEKKGVDLLIRGYRSLKRKGYSLPKLVIAGPGMDSSYGIKIRSLASGDADIFFPGMLSGDAKWGAFYGCEVFALPSHQENFGIAIVEALSCSKAVLITKQVNIWQEITAHEAGLVSTDSQEGITGLLITWFELSDRERSEMMRNARQTYLSNFAGQTVNKKLVTAISDETFNSLPVSL